MRLGRRAAESGQAEHDRGRHERFEPARTSFARELEGHEGDGTTCRIDVHIQGLNAEGIPAVMLDAMRDVFIVSGARTPVGSFMGSLATVAAPKLGAVAIPLLFETKAEAELDEVICVACTAETQLHRLRARGWPDEQIAQRLQAQWPIEEKIARSSYVIWTEASLEIHAAQLDRILRGL